VPEQEGEQDTVPPVPAVAENWYDWIAKFATAEVAAAPSVTVVGDDEDGEHELPVQVQPEKIYPEAGVAVTATWVW
jgi:hypothetical protein